MVETIRDGTGSGSVLQIDTKNRIRAYAVHETEASFINRREGEAYSGLWGTDGAGISAASAGNYVLYLKNTSTTKI